MVTKLRLSILFTLFLTSFIFNSQAQETQPEYMISIRCGENKCPDNFVNIRDPYFSIGLKRVDAKEVLVILEIVLKKDGEIVKETSAPRISSRGLWGKYTAQITKAARRLENGKFQRVDVSKQSLEFTIGK